ncbi:protein tirA-like [Asterias rubens]|uniref:protein tirA-like n=1 Tax=Asterias rubens TaxID=7604 RepID=UPI001455AC2D|nr:protein tirA-like [Asterias rubens]
MGTASSKKRSKKRRPQSAPPGALKSPSTPNNPNELSPEQKTGSPSKQRASSEGTIEVNQGLSSRKSEEAAVVNDSGGGEPVKKPPQDISSTDAEEQVTRSLSMEPKDIMISYSHQDKDQMRKIKGSLEEAGIKVWVDEVGLKAGVEFFNKIGQAIVDAKLFLSLLSTKSVISKYCKDELALAYVSSKPIFPCALQVRDEVIPSMDFGMRLQLAPVTWFMFDDSASYNQSMKDLLTDIKAKLAEMQEEKKTSEAVADKRAKFQRQRSHLNLHSKPSYHGRTRVEFWEKNFKALEAVEWEHFEEAFYKDYQTELDEMFKKVDQKWLLSILCNELDEDGDGIVSLKHFKEFCVVNGESFEFWQRVQEQALESYTMREVFSMDSTVRIDAIQNLSKFHSNSVVEALLDLCNDPDENVRAVAALSLARVAEPSNKYAIKRMMHLLKDKDRLVREGGCLALGHIKASEAASELVNLWRNDAISNVREAAQIALEKIGGEEAQKAMHITKVLSEEIKNLAEKP